MPPADRFVARTELYVRYVETDAMGIVHHTNYIVYFEEARSEYARQRGNDYASFEATGHYLAVTEINARYIKPARYGQRLVILCWIENLRSRGLTFAYEVINADTSELLMTGVSSHVCITQAGKVAPLPEIWRAWTP